jgi:hypothetical protein
MGGMLQNFVIRTSPWPPLRWGYAAVYAGALLWLVARLRRVPEIRSVDLRFPRTGHCFGSSDLDLRAAIAPLSVPEFIAFAERLAHVLLPGTSWRRIFDLYAFPEAEHELQRRLGSHSAVRHERWIRVLGAGTPPAGAAAEDGDARLSRVMYDYVSVCQGVFEGPIDLHHTRLLYSQVVRIDREARAGGACADTIPGSPDADVLAAAHRVAVRGRVRCASFAAAARAHALALAEATALARALPAGAAADGDGSIALVAPGAPADTHAAAIDGCRHAVAALCESTGGAIRSAVLGGIPGCRYEYRIYLVVRDDLDGDAHLALCRAVRELFVLAQDRIPYELFRLRCPTLLTPALWRAAGRWYHALRPVEEHYVLQRHGVVLWGEDSRAEIGAPTADAVRRSAALTIADLRNRIWGALHDRRPRALADLLTAYVPTLWLLLARSLVATSPAETVAGCVAHGFPHAHVLCELDGRLAGVPATGVPGVDDPMWRPALEACTEWLDDLTRMALAAVPAHERDGGVHPMRSKNAR